MDKQLMIRFFVGLLIAGSFAFYLGKHYDRQFAAPLTGGLTQSPFAPLKAGIR